MNPKESILIKNDEKFSCQDYQNLIGDLFELMGEAADILPKIISITCNDKSTEVTIKNEKDIKIFSPPIGSFNTDVNIFLNDYLSSYNCLRGLFIAYKIENDDSVLALNFGHDSLFEGYDVVRPRQLEQFIDSKCFFDEFESGVNMEPWENDSLVDLEKYITNAFVFFFKNISLSGVDVIQSTNPKHILEYGNNACEVTIKTREYSFSTTDDILTFYSELWDIFNQIQDCYFIKNDKFFYGLARHDQIHPLFYISKHEFDLLLKDRAIWRHPDHCLEKIDDDWKFFIVFGDADARRLIELEIINLETKESVCNGQINQQQKSITYNNLKINRI